MMKEYDGSELWYPPVHIKYIPVLGCEMMKEYDGSELWYPPANIKYIPDEDTSIPILNPIAR